jgi:hypothetical protein
MALTPEEKKQIISMLEQEDKFNLKKILASLQSFLNWLMVALYAIYLILIRDPDVLRKLFDFIVKFCL